MYTLKSYEIKTHKHIHYLGSIWKRDKVSMDIEGAPIVQYKKHNGSIRISFGNMYVNIKRSSHKS